MKTLKQILLVIYLLISTSALIAVIIYLSNNIPVFVRQDHYETEKKNFEEHFKEFVSEKDFTKLFNKDEVVVIDYLNASEKYNHQIKFDINFTKISNENIQELEKLSQKWPSSFQQILQHNIVGIYILDSSRFNGQTHFIYSTPDKFAIFLNSKIFNIKPNNWLHKEQTNSLNEEDKQRVEFFIYSDSLNQNIRTVEHVLLHELSHVFSVLYKQNPVFSGRFKEKSGYYPLIEKCYKSGFIYFDTPYLNTEKFSIIIQKEVSDNQKIDVDTYKNLFLNLVNTDFPTPYSIKDSYELVAEILTFYIHRTHLNQKYLVIFDKKDTLELCNHLDTLYLKQVIK